MHIAFGHNFAAHWSALVVYAATAGVLLVGLYLGTVLHRWRSSRALAQRLTALAARLGVTPRDDRGKVEGALALLEEVAGEATTVVNEAGADVIRLRRALDVLPLGLVLCDESGTVLYRNPQAEQLMVSRYGDAIAAQEVTSALEEGWKNGVATSTRTPVMLGWRVKFFGGH